MCGIDRDKASVWLGLGMRMRYGYEMRRGWDGIEGRGGMGWGNGAGWRDEGEEQARVGVGWGGGFLWGFQVVRGCDDGCVLGGYVGHGYDAAGF